MNDEILKLELANKQLHERIDALQLVVSWLLAKQPGEDALLFLRRQANELEPGGKFPEDIAMLDQLAEDVARWHVLFATAPGIQQKNMDS